MARDLGIDIILGIVDLIIEVVESSSRAKTKRKSVMHNNPFRGKASAIGALAKLEEQKSDHSTSDPVYEPMTNKPVKTVSSNDKMAAFAAIKSGKSMANVTPEPTTSTDAFDAITNEYPTKKPLNPVSATAKQVKLEILLLGYMFQEDDGKISGKEKRAIKKHYKTYQSKLTTEDVKDIKDMSGMDNSLMNIRGFLSQQNVSDSTITNSIRTLKEINREGDRYDSIINRIESSLLESMGY